MGDFKYCNICYGDYLLGSHDLEYCYSLDILRDVKRMTFLDKYCKTIKKKIIMIFSRSRKKQIPFDILDCNINTKCMENSLLIKQIQMKYGEIWQHVLGNYEDFEDLGIGHDTGLDIISISRKLIFELKNRYNTDNASSRKSNYDKLAKFKKKNKEYTVIYGVINDITIEGKKSSISHDGEIIEKYSGMKLLRFILGCDTNHIIRTVQSMVFLYSPTV